MALDAGIVWEMRTSGNNNSGGGAVWDSLVNSTYKWTASGSGTDEYYVELSGGGDPSLTEPVNATTDGTYKIDTNGTLGSLNAGEWDWGDNDTLGYSTVYVRLDDGTDPDANNDDFVSVITGGGTDYSQQDAAQLSLTDLAMTTATTTLTSATGGFTAAMIGNVIQITAGTNFTTGWYEITGHTDTNTVTIDRDATTGSNASSGTGAVGGAVALPIDAHFEAWTAGNKMYMKAGTYSTAAINVIKDGTNLAMMEVEGYNTTRGDAPTGTNRPLIAAAANALTFDTFWRFKHIRITTTSASGLRVSTSGQCINCKSDNSSGVANRSGFELAGSYHMYVDCEGISTNGEAFINISSSCKFLYCYAHDSDVGFEITLDNYLIAFCIADTCTTHGIRADNVVGNDRRFLHNTIYNCGTAISLDALADDLIMNNLIDSNTNGIVNDTDLYEADHIDYNNYNGNTTDVTNISKGPNATALVPGFANAAGGDFSGVDVADGFGIRLGVGA